MFIHPNGNFMYVGNAETIDIYSINPSTGALTDLGTPFTMATSTEISDMSPNGQVLIGVFHGMPSDMVAIYLVNGTTGAISEISGSPYTINAAAYAWPFTLMLGPAS